MSHAYAHLFGPEADRIAVLHGLRPLGPAGTWHISASRGAIVSGEPIALYDGGRLKRDFTYVDDIVSGVVGCLAHPPDSPRPCPRAEYRQPSERGSAGAGAPAGAGAWGGRRSSGSVPRPLMDVEETYADVAAIGALTGFRPADLAGRGHFRVSWAWFPWLEWDSVTKARSGA